MNRLLTMRLGLLAVVLGLAAGCQNQMTVRVERVLVDPEAATLQRDSRLGRTVEATLASLDQLRQAYDSILITCEEGAKKKDTKTEQAKKEEVEKKDTKEKQVNYFGPLIKTVQGRRAATRERISVLEDLFNRTDAGAAEIRWELCRTGVFLGGQNRFASDLKVALVKAKESLGKEGDATRQALDNIQSKVLPQTVKTAEAAETRTGQVMFGGFSSADVYEINASDPIYRQILSASPPAFSRACITRVDAGATGDSTIMIVMESPCQFRLYQISNDPTRIVKNLSLITQKVLAAALRFAVGA